MCCMFILLVFNNGIPAASTQQNKDYPISSYNSNELSKINTQVKAFI